MSAHTPRFMSHEQMSELLNLYHLAKVPLSGQTCTPYTRMLWATDQFGRKYPEIGAMAAYKDLSAQLETRR